MGWAWRKLTAAERAAIKREVDRNWRKVQRIERDRARAWGISASRRDFIAHMRGGE